MGMVCTTSFYQVNYVILPYVSTLIDTLKTNSYYFFEHILQLSKTVIKYYFIRLKWNYNSILQQTDNHFLYVEYFDRTKEKALLND